MDMNGTKYLGGANRPPPLINSTKGRRDGTFAETLRAGIAITLMFVMALLLLQWIFLA